MSQEDYIVSQQDTKITSCQEDYTDVCCVFIYTPTQGHFETNTYDYLLKVYQKYIVFYNKKTKSWWILQLLVLNGRGKDFLENTNLTDSLPSLDWFGEVKNFNNFVGLTFSGKNVFTIHNYITGEDGTRYKVRTNRTFSRLEWLMVMSDSLICLGDYGRSKWWMINTFTLGKCLSRIWRRNNNNNDKN